MIFNAILSFLGNGALKTVTQGIIEARRDVQRARNATERLEAEKDVAQLQAQQTILLAEQGSWMTRPIRALFALPFIIYNMKIVVWDKVLGLGVTDVLSNQMMQVEMIVIGAYFVGRPLEKAARRLTGG